MRNSVLWLGYVVLAVGASLLMASLAMRLFTKDTYKAIWKESKARAVYQWIFNFLGAGVGWLALAYLIGIRGRALLTYAEATDVAVALLAFAGISGVLPYLVVTKGVK